MTTTTFDFDYEEAEEMIRAQKMLRVSGNEVCYSDILYQTLFALDMMDSRIHRLFGSSCKTMGDIGGEADTPINDMFLRLVTEVQEKERSDGGKILTLSLICCPKGRKFRAGRIISTVSGGEGYDDLAYITGKILWLADKFLHANADLIRNQTEKQAA